MPKYMINASYSTQGINGILAEGGSSRAAAVEALAKSVGGSVEAFYFSMGKHDVVAIVDLPDNAAAAAIAMTVGAGGGLSSYRTTVLLTAAEMDAATKKSPAYRPPGG